MSLSNFLAEWAIVKCIERWWRASSWRTQLVLVIAALVGVWFIPLGLYGWLIHPRLFAHSFGFAMLDFAIITALLIVPYWIFSPLAHLVFVSLVLNSSVEGAKKSLTAATAILKERGELQEGEPPPKDKLAKLMVEEILMDFLGVESEEVRNAAIARYVQKIVDDIREAESQEPPPGAVS